jgi:hypothetical protein
MDDNAKTDTRDAPAPGEDERRATVDPASSPRPVNPPVDEEALKKGVETIERVKPY